MSGTCVFFPLPGTANKTTFFPAHISVVDIVCRVPSASKCCSFASGILSPTLMTARGVTFNGAEEEERRDDDDDDDHRLEARACVCFFVFLFFYGGAM